MMDQMMPPGGVPGGDPGGMPPVPGGGVDDIDRMLMDVIRVLPMEVKLELLENLLARGGAPMGGAPMGGPPVGPEAAMGEAIRGEY